MEQSRDELPLPISLPNAEEQGFRFLDDFTPEGSRSTVTIQEATNSLCRLQIVESPKSRFNCSDGKRSRLNTDAKGKILFYRMLVGLMMNCIL